MKITGFKLRQVEGTMVREGEFWEERLRIPLDIYSEYRNLGMEMHITYPKPLGNNRWGIGFTFLEINTDEGITGIAGPILPELCLDTIVKAIQPRLIGKDPLATEYLWDLMYLGMPHARQGDSMIAISYVDIALWDIKGKYFNVPIYRLLGGPQRKEIPAYASALGFSLEKERVRERVKWFQGQGFKATKWFIHHGTTEGNAGIRKIVELAETIREAAGPDDEFMLDAWKSWDVPYTLKVLNQVAPYDPSWMEEPVMPELIDSMVRIRDASPIPISGGEHTYTRFGAKQLMDAGALDIYQLDPIWAGGVSEIMKVCTLASAYDVRFLAHGTLIPVNANISFTQNAMRTPCMEYLYLVSIILQHFYKNPSHPVNGVFLPPTAPGCSLDLDPAKIEKEREIKL